MATRTKRKPAIETYSTSGPYGRHPEAPSSLYIYLMEAGAFDGIAGALHRHGLSVLASMTSWSDQPERVITLMKFLYGLVKFQEFEGKEALLDKVERAIKNNAK